MDGTLLTEEKEISNQNAQAINYFIENGGSFTIASGRMYEKMLLPAKKLKLHLPIISHNGCVIYDINQKKALHIDCLQGNYKKIIEEIYNDHPYIGILAFAQDKPLYINVNKYSLKLLLDEKFVLPEDVPNIKSLGFEKFDNDYCKILIATTPQNCDNFEKIFPNKYKDLTFIRSEAHYYEIIPKNVNKCTATIKLKEILNINGDKLYAIGDNMNDAELLKYADVGIAVKNASDGLKNVSDMVLPYTNEQNAVAEVINMIEKGLI